MNILFMIGNEKIIDNEQYPLFLTEIDHKTILEKQIEKIQNICDAKVIFCISGTTVKKFNLDFVIEKLIPTSTLVMTNGETKGALCTSLLPSKYIDTNDELLLLAIDDFVDIEYTNIIDYFRNKQSDAGVVSFHSIHPKYAYVKEENLIPLEFAEKKPISKNALASFYYFKKGSDFVTAAKEVIRKDNPLNDRFYISMAYNELILSHKKISVYQINKALYHSFKNTIELARYISEYKEKAYTYESSKVE